MLEATRPTRAEIDLTAIRHNVAVACSHAGPSARVMAVVKADAYGHGAVPVARAALFAGATWLGVAIPEEGVALRQAGIGGPILVMGPTAPQQVELIAAHGLDQMVCDEALGGALSRVAVRRQRAIGVHVKVDTGMTRVGLAPERARDFCEGIAGLPGLHLRGIMTHLATADDPDKSFAQEQLARFAAVWDGWRRLQAGAAGRPLRHAANSAGLLEVPASRLDLVRPGIMLYGYSPSDRPPPVSLRPALRLRSEVAYVQAAPRGTSVSYGRTFIAPRDLRVATVPAGYADGVTRLLSNRGAMLVRGRRRPIVGCVCMDMTMLDVTDPPDVHPGDEAVIIGAMGDEAIGADEIGRLVGTISYEVLCGIGPRVPRVYSGGDPET